MIKINVCYPAPMCINFLCYGVSNFQYFTQILKYFSKTITINIVVFLSYICVLYISGFRDLSIYVTYIYTCHQERYCLNVTGPRVILLPNMLYLIYFIKRFILKISTDSTTKQDTKHQANSDHSLLVLVKVLVHVPYKKYSMRDGVEKVIYTV